MRQLVPSRRRVARKRPGRAGNQLQVPVAFKAGDRQRSIMMPSRRPSAPGFVIVVEETAAQAEPIILLFDANQFQANQTVM